MVGKLFRNLYQKKVVVLVLLVIILITVAIGGYLYMTRDTSPIPSQIQKQLTFSPFVLPSNTNNYSATDYKFNTTEGNNRILSYNIKTNNITIVVYEQPQPPQFVEIPGYKDSFLNNVAKQYDTVATSNGVIYLGRLSRQNNKQLGIMLEKGLLVFLYPNKELDQAHWRMLGNQLEIQKIGN